jgi:hypothetical protein
MANVSAKVTGGRLAVYDANCVCSLKEKMDLSGNYTAQVNGETVGDDHELEDDDFVTFTQAVKGGDV